MSTEYMHGCCKNATGRTQDVPLTQRERHYLSLYRVNENGCWLFQGNIMPDGYGRAGRLGYAHRFFYERLVGPVAPRTLHLDHLCRVRSCVNPAHLEPVTAYENMVTRAPGHPGKVNRDKTHCKHGHEFTPENTRVTTGRSGRPGRMCKTCNLAAMREYRSRKAASNG